MRLQGIVSLRDMVYKHNKALEGRPFGMSRGREINGLSGESGQARPSGLILSPCYHLVLKATHGAQPL